MQINITDFFNACTPCEFSASAFELGEHAGEITWKAALKEAANTRLLKTEEELEAFRKFVLSFGGWTKEEVAAWTELELNALCIQWIAGDMREPADFQLDPDSTDDMWEDYIEQSQYSLCSGRLSRSADGQIYWEINE